MTLKYRISLIAAVAAAVLAAIGYLRPVSKQGMVAARSVDLGVEVPNTNGKAKQFRNGVYEIKPENFAVTGNLKDLPDLAPGEAGQSAEQLLEEMREKRAVADRTAKGLPPMTEEQKENWEINQQNAERVKKVDPAARAGSRSSQDPLVNKSLANRPDSPNAPEAMPTPSLTFDGAGSVDNSTAGAGSGFTPADPNGDVGPNHYVNTINLVIKVFNKDGSVAAAPKKTSSLFAALPTGDPCRSRNDGDPIVVYDSLADRWVVSQFSMPAGIGGTGSNNYECIAVSTTPDPTGSYYVWSYVYPGSQLNDYPKMGVWTDAYHMTFNQFNNAGTAYQGMGILSQDRAKALVGDPSTSVVYKNIFTVDATAGGGLPADIDGLVPPPAGMSELIAEFRADEFVSTDTDSIRYYKWVPNFASPADSSMTVLPDVGLAPFDARSPDTSDGIEVSGGAGLDSIADRMMHRLAYRNLGTAANPVNSYLGNFTVNVSGLDGSRAANYQAGIRWFEMRRVNDTFAVNDQGTHSTGAINGITGTNNWMGSIAQDNQGNIALGFSQASSTQKADIKIAGRSGAPDGTLNAGEALMWAAQGVQTTSHRWGDYSSMSVDPTDDCTFWYTQEYYAANATSVFSTRVGKFKFPSCTAAPKGTITGTITSCSTGLPVLGANVVASGGFQRLTTADGNYSMTVTPGNYAVGADKLSNGFLGASTNVTVTDGSAATANICLAAVPVLAQGASSIVSESCGLPNQAPDPGENVTVSLDISNVGGANTANLTATLQNTGGVANAGPAQNYGAVQFGGPAVTRNFTFTVSRQVACGSPITLTWEVSDGTTSYGTMTKKFSTGTPVLSLTQNFDAVTAPALPSGWTQNQIAGTAITWKTVTAPVNSSPNAALANDPSTVSDAALESPAFQVSIPNATLSFQKAFTTELNFDGAVLEIKTGSGPWQDILAAGGSFASGGYNAVISAGFSSPIAGRQAWSGTSGNYTETQVLLPASAVGQTVQLRWRMASDDSFGSTGFLIDDVQVTAGASCSCPAKLSKARADFDGDGKTDVSVFRPSEGNWYIYGSTAGFTGYSWGSSTDTIVPGDWDGDGKTDAAVFRATGTDGLGYFYALKSSNFTSYGAQWGLSSDVPVIADYDGDGKADLAIYRPPTGQWAIFNSSNQTVSIYQFGAPGDIPFAMDQDGDGKANIAVFRPSDGTWYIAKSTVAPAQNFDAYPFGFATDKIVPADYDGDGKDDVAVFRPSNGVWYILQSSNGQVVGVQFGAEGDIPVPGDYDGDGKADIAVYRGGAWYLNRSTAGFAGIMFGLPTDIPVPARYIP